MIPKLNPNKFMFENHSNDNSFLLYPDYSKVIGWCSSEQTIMPKKSRTGNYYICIMINDGGNDYWIHESYLILSLEETKDIFEMSEVTYDT